MAVAAIAVLSSCSKEDDNNASKDSGAFYATIEDGTTRTTLGTGDNANKVLWSSGDKISINGEVYTLSDGDGTTHATFTGESVSGTPYKAYYPADLYNGTTATLPATQEYDATTNGISNLPMYAQSTTHDLVFKNLCGVLEITVPNTVMSTVKQITVTADQRLNGTFTVTIDDNTGIPSISFTGGNTLTAADKMVTLVMENAVTVGNGGAKFYVAIPANTYSSLQIDVIGKNASSQIAAKRLTTTSSPIAVSRNVIYPISFSNANVTDAITGTALVESTSGRTSCEWVQLWSGGPMFATVNVGATISDYDYLDATAETVRGGNSISNYTTANVGGLYCWGGKTFKNFRVGTEGIQVGENADCYYSSDLTDIANTDRDIAKGLWGSSWRMPTRAELNSLNSSTNCTWSSSFVTKGSGSNTIQGSTVTGVGSSYGSNSIFLPAPGYFQENSLLSVGTNAAYWSSTPSSTDLCAYSLNFITGYQVEGSNFYGGGCSVRAVLAVE